MLYLPQWKLLCVWVVHAAHWSGTGNIRH